MNEKLYIRKEKVDIRIISFAICVFVMWNVSSHFRYRQSWISTDPGIISSVIFLVFFYCFMFFRNRRKNDIIKAEK